VAERPIYHIAEPEAWQRALGEGVYTRSTRNAGLAEIGFIHCSFLHQVETVANAVYADWDGPLLLVEVRPDGIPAEIRVESVGGGTDRFPHIYGSLPTAAVSAVHLLARRAGRWWLPPALTRK
jgi:uncharacterized protein (DUF952 family)